MNTAAFYPRPLPRRERKLGGEKYSVFVYCVISLWDEYEDAPRASCSFPAFLRVFFFWPLQLFLPLKYNMEI